MRKGLEKVEREGQRVEEREMRAGNDKKRSKEGLEARTKTKKEGQRKGEN